MKPWKRSRKKPTDTEDQCPPQSSEAMVGPDAAGGWDISFCNHSTGEAILLLSLLNVDVVVSHVQLFVTPRTIAQQIPVSMGFSRQEDWSGLPFLLQGIFPTQGSNLGLLHCRLMLHHLSHQGSPQCLKVNYYNPDKPLWIELGETWSVMGWWAPGMCRGPRGLATTLQVPGRCSSLSCDILCGGSWTFNQMDVGSESRCTLCRLCELGQLPLCRWASLSPWV